MRFLLKTFLPLLLQTFFSCVLMAQVTERARPAAWNDLVPGAKFLDLFQPIPITGQLASGVWGSPGVVPRYVANGIEDSKWSYWGGNILQDTDGSYHLYVCRWAEDAPKGHMEWPNSIVVHAVSTNSIGPYKVVDEIGKGHNPEIYQTKNGRYVLYVIDGYYTSASLNGPWEYGQFDFDPRDRPIIEGLSNLTFAQRADGSYLMICRGGGAWISKDGKGTYEQVSDKRAYPPVEGRFEDPVVWRDEIQYYLIVNDWLGRIAFYLRSPDGIHWKTDPGQAYQPGITVYEDGTSEDWFKYERLKILQDEHGRAYQANFAVIDTLKHEDRPNDRHSSKNISIPLQKGLLMEVLNKREITPRTKEITVKIKAEEGFAPLEELEVASLRFGASEEVNFGRGSQPKSSRADGDDLIVVFDAKDNGLTKSNFAGKLLGRNKKGEVVFAFSRLPAYPYEAPILSAKIPTNHTADSWKVAVKNYGMAKSAPETITVSIKKEKGWVVVLKGKVPALAPYDELDIPLKNVLDIQSDRPIAYSIKIGNQVPEILTVER